jgi:DNA polymerase V
MKKKFERRGGYRQGAGRPEGSGKYREQTQVVRVPVSKVSHVLKVIDGGKSGNALDPDGDKVEFLPYTAMTSPADHNTQYSTLFTEPVQAGFPSPAGDHEEQALDLNQLLIKRPEASFFVRAAGDSMIDAGIHQGDLLVVDRSLDPRHGQIVIARLDSEFTVKRLYIQDRLIRLVAENPNYPAIEVTADMDFEVWGVVTGVVRSL